jgi:hypothetical protein
VLIVAASSSDKRVRRPPSRDLERRTHPTILSQPTRSPLYEDGLLTRFLEFFSRAARRSSWTFKLPRLKDHPSAHALRSSLRAVSLAYFAHITQDRSAQLESLRHYGFSLARQRSALIALPKTYQGRSKIAGGEIDIDAATNALLATVILSYFELISPGAVHLQSASVTAWISHTIAAEQIIVLLGPGALSNDIVGQLFFSVRSHAVYRAAALGHYTVFAEKEWLEAASKHVPKQSYARSAYDRVTELVLRLSRTKILGSHTDHFSFGTDTDDGTEDTPKGVVEELRRRYRIFLQICRRMKVEEIPLFVARRTPARKSSSHDIDTHVGQTTDEEDMGQDKDVLQQPNPSPVDCLTMGVLAEGPADLRDLHPKLQKQFAAMTTAYFHAAAILVQVYFPDVARSCIEPPRLEDSICVRGSGPTDTRTAVAWDARKTQTEGLTRGIRESTSYTDVLHNAKIILAASRYLSPEGKSNGIAVLRMMLPFSVIWNYCRDETAAVEEDLSEEDNCGAAARLDEGHRVRREARSLFSEWCAREGMSGIARVGFGDDA